jgi:DNA helicase-2/ATP-dependent DNA helicase PcrA
MVERMFPWLDRLNDEQRAAVTFDGGPLRILAGAGTGKTTTLTSRVAWLIATGTPSERILLLTFTRRAAREMIARTEALVGRSGTASTHARARVVGGTFHSVAHRVLRRNAAALGLPDGFSVLDPADAADVMDLVRHETGVVGRTGRRFPRKATLLDLYSRSVNTGSNLTDTIAEVAPWCREQVDAIAEVCRGYVALKRARGLLDFDDLLLYWRAAAAHPELGKALGAEFDHVLVDEYQDVNALQVDIVAALRRHDGRVTVVGDDSQAVYGFRGASPRHLLDIDLVFPSVETIALGRNYRSTQPILDVANGIGEAAPSGFAVRLRADEPGGAAPTLVRCADEDVEVQAICESVLAHREEGVALREQAVLVRAAHHSDLLELELSRRRIPYVKYGGLKFLEAAHVKDLMCAFRLADNPRDELAWFRLLQLLDGVGPATARRVVAALGLDEDGTAGDVLLRWSLAAEELPAVARDGAERLAAAISPKDHEEVGTHAERLLEALTPVIEGVYDDAAARLADLDALVTAAHGAARLSDVAADLTIEPPQSTSDLAGPPLVDEDWLVISTVHSAKGLEWDVVHLMRASDGNFPSDMALTSADGLEEERRLFYVAVTRPRRHLHVYLPLRFHVPPRARGDRHLYGQPSRFLSDRILAGFDQRSVGHLEAEPAIRLDAAAEVGLELDALWS